MLLHPLWFVFVSEKQTISQFLANTELLMKFCMWEFQDHKSDKTTFVPEISNKEWCQENNASFLILSISSNALFTNMLT